MLKDIIPEDLQSLIIATRQTPRPDPEIAEILPPRTVQKALLAELGITAPLPESEQQVARDWVAKQLEVQAEAMQVQAELQKSEPFLPEEVKMGRLPIWAVRSWAQTLNFEWSDNLSTAVDEAKEYLSAKVK